MVRQTKKVLCNYKREMFKRCCSTITSHLRLHKKQVTSEDKMNSVVTYVNIRLKCYINLFTWFYIVPKRMGSCDVLANAINKLDESLIKKISKSISPTS